jgi:hypothetical protein
VTQHAENRPDPARVEGWTGLSPGAGLIIALIIQFIELVNGLRHYLKPEKQSVMSLKSTTIQKVVW